MKKILSVLLSMLMLFSIFGTTGITAFAKASADELISTTAVMRTGQTKTFVLRRGKQNASSPYYGETRMIYKFTPEKTGYYEASLKTKQTNRSMYLLFEDAEAKTLAIKSNNGAQYAVAAAKLTAGRPYYLVAESYVDDLDLEGDGYSAAEYTLSLSVHTHAYEVKTYEYTNYSVAQYTCPICQYTFRTTVYKLKSVALSKTAYTYDGKVKKPSVIVKDTNGNRIAASNYTASYQSGRKKPGKYTVTIKFKGSYAKYGTVKKTFTIKPKGTSISKLTKKKKGFTVKWKKQATQTSGYQIQYSTSGKFKNAKTVTVSKNKTTSKTVKKLKAKKKYYVRVRTYKTVKVNGKSTKIYSAWSKAKSVTTK